MSKLDMKSFEVTVGTKTSAHPNQSGSTSAFYINGNDHPTKDGTNVRDFIDLDILSQFIFLIIKKDFKKNT